MKRPVVKVSMQRGWYNVLSTMTAHGDMTYSIKYDTVNRKRYIEFLEEIISNRDRHLILLLYHSTFHGYKEIRMFVRAHRGKLSILFLPKRAPEFNPDEQARN